MTLRSLRQKAKQRKMLKKGMHNLYYFNIVAFDTAGVNADKLQSDARKILVVEGLLLASDKAKYIEFRDLIGKDIAIYYEGRDTDVFVQPTKADYILASNTYLDFSIFSGGRTSRGIRPLSEQEQSLAPFLNKTLVRIEQFLQSLEYPFIKDCYRVYAN